MSSNDMLIDDIITQLKTFDKVFIWLWDYVGALVITSYKKPITAMIMLDTENAQINILTASKMYDLQAGVSRWLVLNDRETSGGIVMMFGNSACFLLKDSTIAQLESPRCCNQKKTQWKYWTQWTFRPLKNAKIQTKTHEMDVLEAVEDETLESHSRD